MEAADRFARKRPLALLAAMAALGAAVGVSAHAPPAVYYALSALGGLLLLRWRHAVLPICLCALVFAGYAGAMAAPRAGALPDKARLTGVVREQTVRKERSVCATLTDAALDGRVLDTDVRVYVYGDAAYRVGERLSMTARIFLPQTASNPGGFDFAAWLKRRGVSVCATASAEDVAVRAGGAYTPAIALERLREWVARSLSALFRKPDEAALAQALVLGDKRALSEGLSESFRQSGIAHLLAVSGLHVSCVAAALYLLLRRLRVARNAAFLCALPVVLLYAALSAFPASAVRALTLFCLVGWARLRGRPYDVLTGLAAALLFLLLKNPLDILDPGLLLSFSAVLGILCLNRLIRGLLPARPRPLRKPLAALSVSLSAQIGLLPATACLFGALSLYAPFTSLVAIPVVTLLLPLLLALLPLFALWPPLAMLPALAARGMLRFLIGLATVTAKLPFATLSAPALPIALVALFFAVLFLASPYARTRRVVKRALLAALIGVFALGYPVARRAVPERLAVTMLDAGQADALLVSAEGRLYAVDVGDPDTPLPSYLLATGRGLDGVFLTHPHDDHAGGLAALLAVRDIPAIYLPTGFFAQPFDPSVLAGLALAEERGVPIRMLAAGDEVRLSPNVVARSRYPASDSRAQGNARSLVLHVDSPWGSALLLGDWPISAEIRGLPDCDLLKVAHHGADDGTSAMLLFETTPTAAFVSVGRNSYGHPAQALLDRLRAQGARVYRSDKCGAVTARFGPNGALEIETFR